MTPVVFLSTALLLGLFVLAAGCYGLWYALARLSRKRIYMIAACASYGIQCCAALAVVALCPLGTEWKVLLVISTAVYLGIPPVTWRYLTALHDTAELR